MNQTPEGFEDFVRRYQDMVYSTALRILGRPAEAEDMAQEAFLKAYERYSDLKDSPTAGGWLKTVTTNLCLNHLSRYRSRWTMFSEIEEPGETLEFKGKDDPVGDWDKKLVLEGLSEALQNLPDHQRIPLVLFHYEERSYEQISRGLGVSLSKVKSDIFRGRAALYKSLKEKS